FVSAGDRNRSRRGKANRPRRHVYAPDFDTIQINNCAIIAHELECHRVECGSIGDTESAAKVCRDELVVRVRTEADRRRFIAVTVTQLRWTRRPGRVVE